MKKNEVDKEEIEKLGLNAIKEYFNIDKDEMAELKPDVLRHIHKKAHLGMQFEREMSVGRRSVELNYIRVFRLIAEDKKELKKLIKQSLPHYYSG